MSRLPREARDGLMRAWLEILRERHPGISWVPAEQERRDAASRVCATETDAHTPAEAVTTVAA
jgi:hypothetical protein